MTATRTVAGRAPWPPLIYLAAIGVAALLGWSYPLPWIGGLLGDLLFAIGWLVLLAVAVLWFTAFRAVTATRTTLCSNGLPEHLVTNGPFAVSRNPIYLANTLLLIGVCFVGALPWFLPLAFVAALATSRLAIQPGEKILAAKFGKKYRDYARKVRRWI